MCELKNKNKKKSVSATNVEQHSFRKMPLYQVINLLNLMQMLRKDFQAVFWNCTTKIYEL